MILNENLKFDSSQDWLTLLGWEHMELFYQLPCQVFFWGDFQSFCGIMPIFCSSTCKPRRSLGISAYLNTSGIIITGE